jgi:hypothetical protein
VPCTVTFTFVVAGVFVAVHTLGKSSETITPNVFGVPT